MINRRQTLNYRWVVIRFWSDLPKLCLFKLLLWTNMDECTLWGGIFSPVMHMCVYPLRSFDLQVPKKKDRYENNKQSCPCLLDQLFPIKLLLPSPYIVYTGFGTMPEWFRVQCSIRHSSDVVLKGPKHDQIVCWFFYINPTYMDRWLRN